MKYGIKSKISLCFFLLLLMSSCGDRVQSKVVENSTEVLVEPKITSLDDLATDQVKLIGIGNENVPVGRYSKELLEKMNLWHAIEGKISYASSVREVLTQVEMGAVDCGIVYQTDAYSSDKVEVVEYLDGTLLDSPVVYPMCKISDSPNSGQADVFLRFLCSNQGNQVFSDAGFIVIPENESIIYDELEACTLSIFAASSLTESLTKVMDAFHENHENIDFIVNFDSSGTLSTQIEYGAQVDIFISASHGEMLHLIECQKVQEEDVIDFLKNELVLITGQ